MILAVPTRAFSRASQVGPKTFTIFANTSVVLAGTSRADFLYFGFVKGVGTLFQGRFNRRFTVSTRLVGIQASNTCTSIGVADLAHLKASAVQFEATGANAIAGFAGRELVGSRVTTTAGKGSWIPS